MRVIRRWCSMVAGVALTAALTGATLHAQVFIGDLSGLNELPPNASPGTGRAVVELMGNNLSIYAIFAGLLAPTTAAHIHCCAGAEADAGVAVHAPSLAGFPLGVTSGTYSNIFDLAMASSYHPSFLAASGGTALLARDRLVSEMLAGNTYFNIHTDGALGGFPRGEIRGQLHVTPEPASVALLGTGLLGIVGAARWRRRKREGDQV